MIAMLLQQMMDGHAKISNIESLVVCIYRSCWTVGWYQGRNFGLKNILEGEGGTLGSRGEGRMDRKYPLVIRLWGLGEHRELSQRGYTPAENGFIVI